MDAQLLRDQGIFPTKEVLRKSLGSSFSVFSTFLDTITGIGFELLPEWTYYKDGKAWLCKVCHKKKTVLWLSAWDGFFKVSFFFTEKHLEGIAALAIAERIKQDICLVKPVGRLLPLIIDIRTEEQLADVLTLVEFKKNLK